MGVGAPIFCEARVTPGITMKNTPRMMIMMTAQFVQDLGAVAGAAGGGDGNQF